MITERQVCVKCGRVFAEREIGGPDFAIEAMRSSESSKMCPKCGGDVIWQAPNSQHGSYEIPEYARVGLLDEIGFIIAIIFVLAIVIMAVGQYFGWWRVVEFAK
jgi:ribosomal protein S27AE